MGFIILLMALDGIYYFVKALDGNCKCYYVVHSFLEPCFA